MSRSEVKKAGWVIRRGLATVLAIPLAAPVHAQVRGVVDVSVQGTVASNSSLENSRGGGAFAFGLQVDPSVFYEDGEVTTAALRGTVAVDQYDADNGTVGSLGLTAGMRHKISERTSIRGSASARSTRSGVRDFLRNPVLASDVLQNLNPDLLPELGGQADINPGGLTSFDPDLLDEFDFDLADLGRGRTNTFQVGASVDHAISSSDSVSFGGSVRLNSSGDPRGSDYRSDSVSVAYRRALSTRTSFNVGISGGRADYEDGGEGPGPGDAIFVTPAVGISHRLSETLTASASVGASITSVERHDGASEKDVGLAGNLGLCQLQYRASLCATASRGVQPTSFGGVTSVTSAGLAYSRLLGLRDRVSASARYSRRDDSLVENQSDFGGAQSVFAASASYNRSIGQRLYAFVTPGFSRTSGSLTGDRDNYQISVGIRYRFGDAE
ncbi:hypothetical protein [Parafrankia sp. BMG5.11]|uniref:hypothetical protein n=1 Tax=Parafrankia sp. BMG5.11 TaxID=222540 RepID=UPI001038B7B3|nr:hypothetical protein [Parafrankia sp. BMG5.11]TCJ34967.1 hypothetical protein E0504_30355 [Parafrankia sp. BMG5.11]